MMGTVYTLVIWCFLDQVILFQALNQAVVPKYVKAFLVDHMEPPEKKMFNLIFM